MANPVTLRKLTDDHFVILRLPLVIYKLRSLRSLLRIFIFFNLFYTFTDFLTCVNRQNLTYNLSELESTFMITKFDVNALVPVIPIINNQPRHHKS